MRVTKLFLVGALALGAPALAADQQQQGGAIPKDKQVQIKNKGDVDAAKSDLTVPERKFVERAASNDIAEIELGRLALDKSKTPEVRNLAQTLVDDHQKSLDQLKSIANDQKFPLPTSATTLAQQQYQQLSKLQGQEFDREYQRIVDKRHDDAVNMYQTASRDLKNPDLKSFADKTPPR